MDVAVCIITYQRPEGLRRALQSLNDLTFSRATPTAGVFVIDNDPAGSAKRVCEGIRPLLRWPLYYESEATRGCAPARNRAIKSAAPEAPWLAFFDDDEVPTPAWLDELLRVQREYQADIVAGPALPYFDAAAPAWIVRGRFFEPRRYPTGYPLTEAYDGNMLLRSTLYTERGMLFDERFALMGGHDSHFSRGLARAGYKLVWADDAIVHEWVPATRISARWLTQRMYRAGCATAMLEADLSPGWRSAATTIAKAAAWKAIGSLELPSGLVLGKRGFVRGLRHIAYGAGLMSGLFGGRFEEYRTVHGA